MAPELTFVLFQWSGQRPTTYTEPRVAALCAQLRDHVRIPFRIVLLAEQAMSPDGVDEVRPAPPELVAGNINGSPVNCTRRIRLFDPSYAETIGTEWLAVLDVDMLILDDVTDVVEFGASAADGLTFLRGRSTREATLRPYNGALWFLRVGAHRYVWDDWDPASSPSEIEGSGWIGSDQVWFSLKVKDVPTVGPEHGVYYLGEYERMVEGDPPARIVNYAGNCKPWSRMARNRTPELYDYYCDYDPTAPR